MSKSGIYSRESNLVSLELGRLIKPFDLLIFHWFLFRLIGRPFLKAHSIFLSFEFFGTCFLYKWNSRAVVSHISSISRNVSFKMVPSVTERERVGLFSLFFFLVYLNFLIFPSIIYYYLIQFCPTCVCLLYLVFLHPSQTRVIFVFAKRNGCWTADKFT